MRNSIHQLAVVIGTLMLSGGMAWAQAIPSAADASRIEPQPMVTPIPAPSETLLPKTEPAPMLTAPEGAKAVTFTLEQVNVTGVTAFPPEELSALYAGKLHQQVSLEEIYDIANVIAGRYRDEGYFLTRVSVPDQSIKSGVVTIAVTEGYISKVALNDPLAGNSVVQGYIDRILAEKPIRSKTLESALLGLNDLAGQTFQAVLSQPPSGQPGESMLTLIPHATPISGSVGFDNYGSRFLGPHEMNASVKFSPFPLQQTEIYGLASAPTRELGYGVVRHKATVAPDVTVTAEASVTKAHPGYTLAPLDIESVATDVNLGVGYQWLRQRDQNLSTKLTLEGRNVDSDLAGTPLTRENVRVVRANVSYDVTDALKGSNVANVTLSQGIDGLGSSKKGDINLSRSEAEPDFTKLEVNLSRLQELGTDWAALVQVSGQIASGPLYSSEEFGYGGQLFGRAYDTSELVGDEGVEAGVELRYEGWRDLEQLNLEPYAYYDTGVVTNEDAGQLSRDAASSAGGGVRFATSWGQTGNLGLAVPLTHDTLAPLYGGNHSSPRIIVQISQTF